MAVSYTHLLEGSVRQTGVHACGILISRDPLTEHIPIIPTEGESLMTTQYDGHFVEPIGLIKMDFLGLRTLSIIKTCLENIKAVSYTHLSIRLFSIPTTGPCWIQKLKLSTNILFPIF